MVLRTGWELDYVRDMDVMTFNTLIVIVTRLVYRDKTENAWTSMVAASGQKESMDKLTGAWRAATGDDRDLTAERAKSPTSGAVAFLRALKIDPSRGGRF